jgi:hypothetical protein
MRPDKEDRLAQPVRHRAEAPYPEAGQRLPGHGPPRWTGTGSVDSREVQKRLAWLLLAAEIGMALVAACVLPLVFIKLPVQNEGAVEAVVAKVREWLGVSSQVAWLVVILPIPILLVTLGVNWWWFRRIRHRAKEMDDQE